MWAKRSGRPGGHRRGRRTWFRYRIEQIVRRLADEEPQHAAERLPSHLLPVPVAPRLPVLLLDRTPPAGAVFSCIRVPILPPCRRMLSNSSFQNGPVQKPGTTARSRQISTRVRPSGRRRTCASSSSSVGMKSSGSFQPAGRDGRAVALRAAGASAGCTEAGGSAGAAGGAVARSRGATKLDIAAPRRARKQYALQRGGTQDAALQVRDDCVQPAGAEARRDGVEVGAGGAALRGLGEMAAVAEQDANGVQQCGDARGDGPPGPVRLGIGGRGRTGGGGRVVVHPVSLTVLAAFCQRNYRPGPVLGESRDRLISHRTRRWAGPGNCSWGKGSCRTIAFGVGHEAM